MEINATFGKLIFFILKYRATDVVVPGEGKLELCYTPKSGKPVKLEIFNFTNGGGVGMAMYNTDEVRWPNIFIFLQDISLFSSEDVI